MARHDRKHAARKAASRPASPAGQAALVRKIRAILREEGKLSQAELGRKCHSRRCKANYAAAIQQLIRDGELLLRRHDYILTENSFRAEVVRLHAGFGFIRDEAGTDYFVPGRAFCGAMPGDKVLARTMPSQNDPPEAEVLRITEENPSCRLSGMVIIGEDGLCLLPDSMTVQIRIDSRESVPCSPGDKVLCLLTKRGDRHSRHRVRVLHDFGTAGSAAACMAAYITAQDIPTDFSPEVLREAQQKAETGIPETDLTGRLDLRGRCIFTIDGAAAKDLDDAVSVEQHPDGSWTLGVHIADVSHYVQAGSALDKEAFRRGTSIYYADKVIPMLPQALSNGICSLNGGADRLAFSAFMTLSPAGEIRETRLTKSVIRSVKRGVYSECNAILDGTASPALQEAYAAVTPSLHLLDVLTDRLEALRRERGAPELESTEAALLLDENGRCAGLSPIQRGRSERIIEACMLCANEAVARFAREQELPLVCRVHEGPSPERLDTLKDILEKLGAERPQFHEAQPSDLRRILEENRAQPYFPVVNALVLRAMAKARYSEEPLGHFGLALADYVHFTSPIRRYPDLAVHRILFAYLAGSSREAVRRRFRRFTEQAALRSSETELRAVQLEREADRCYAAEYMQAHVGEVFQGIVSGVTDYGVYVTLENMAEGFLHIHDFPEGEYETEPGWYIRSPEFGIHLGDPVTVLCARADVNGGHIDLAFPDVPIA